jgi:hypothetical protein
MQMFAFTKGLTGEALAKAGASPLGPHQSPSRQPNCPVALPGTHLNPDGIHRAIKDEPLPVRAGVARCIAEQHRQHPICPLLGYCILLAIQLAHADALGVEDIHLGVELVVQPCCMQVCMHKHTSRTRSISSSICVVSCAWWLRRLEQRWAGLLRHSCPAQEPWHTTQGPAVKQCAPISVCF